MEDTLVISISLDGDKWCALIGGNPQEGLAGFGDSPVEALRELMSEIEMSHWNLDNVTLW